MSRAIRIRKATPADIPAVVELAVESVSQQPLPLVVDREGMAEMARELIAGNQHFAHVAECDGRVVGAVGALVQPGFWFKRNQASVVMFYCRQAGAGIALLREFARWVKSRPAIKMALFSIEPGADPRIGTLLHRLGFSTSFPQLAYIRGLA